MHSANSDDVLQPGSRRVPITCQGADSTWLPSAAAPIVRDVWQHRRQEDVELDGCRKRCQGYTASGSTAARKMYSAMAASRPSMKASTEPMEQVPAGAGRQGGAAGVGTRQFQYYCWREHGVLRAWGWRRGSRQLLGRAGPAA